MRSAVVVDASVALKWFVPEEDSTEADRLLEADVEFHAPALLQTEVCNGLWKNLRKGRIGRDEADEALQVLERTINHWHAVGGLLARALDHSTALDHPVYDALYLTLAEERRLTCLTADRRFARKVEQAGHTGRVLHFTEWRP